MPKSLFYSFLCFTLILPRFVLAGEESLDLDQVAAAPAAQKSNSAKPLKFNLMGRVDLTYEYKNPNSNSNPDGSSRNNLDNNHALVFIKVKASDKTSLMGEIAGQKFFYVDYAASLANIQFGKILVPFGDTRRYHHFYGGIQGYGPTGTMFPNIWSEPGINAAWKLPNGEIDTYVVNSIAASSDLTNPDFQSSSTSQQAAGLRYAGSAWSGLNWIFSGYSGEYWKGRSLNMLGFDLYTDYGVFGLGFFKHFRMAFGIANATILSAPVSGEYEKRGDYFEIATPLIGPGETRFRYGTYVDNSRSRSSKDVHNYNLGYTFNVDVIRILVEHQVNMEAVNEINNDVTRIMGSLDF